MVNLNNLAHRLRAAGIEVIEDEGYRTRGHDGPFNPVGVLNHHTGASAKAWSRSKRLAYARWMFREGRSDLPGPICNGALGPDGEFYLGALGRSYHAGTAAASGTVKAGDGNTMYFGIEWMLSGFESIPAEMMAAAITINAVITEEFTQTSVGTISCHYNTSVTGKWDIGDPNGILFKGSRVLDTEEFRRDVAEERERLYRPEPDKAEPLVVGAWNSKVGHRRSYLGEVAEEVKGKDVQGLMETAGHRVDLRKFAREKGFARVTGVQVGKDSEPLSSLLLVREGIKIVKRGVINVKSPWIGPQGGKFSGRYFPWVRVRKDGVDTLVVLVHMPWNPRKNARAVRACHKALRQFAKNHPDVDLLIMGDINEAASSRRVKRTARKIGAKIVPGASGIDYAFFRPRRERPSKPGVRRRVTGKRGSKRGSDHHAATYTFNP